MKKSMQKLKKNSKPGTTIDKKSYLSKRNKAQSKPKKILMFFVKTIGGGILLTGFFYAISYAFFYPKLNVRVSIHHIDQQGLIAYDVVIFNPSNQDIANLNFGFRFDEKFPIKDLSIEGTAFKSGIRIKIHEDIKISEITSRRFDKKTYVWYRSGFSGQTEKFCSGATVLINVLLDKTYNGEMGDVFPPLAPPSLRSNSYFMEYKYSPLGVFSPMLITKKLCYDFDGNKSKTDYFRSYTQWVSFPDGKRLPFSIDLRKNQE